jgi:hypothetical protein
MKSIFTWLNQFLCFHRFDYRDLIARKEPDGNVTWPCFKCGKVFSQHCGLDILAHGKLGIREKSHVSISMNNSDDKPKLFPGKYCIETLECGVWDTRALENNLTDALATASNLCRSIPENRVRISTPDFEIY